MVNMPTEKDSEDRQPTSTGDADNDEPQFKRPRLPLNSNDTPTTSIEPKKKKGILWFYNTFSVFI